MKSLAAFIDLNSIRLGSNMLERALSQIGFENIVEICFYNYDPARNSAFDGIVARYAAKTAPLINGRKRIRTDMRLAVDSVAAAERLRPDAVFLVCGAIDRAPLAERLAAIGTEVIIGTENISEYESAPYDLSENNRVLNNDLKKSGNPHISFLLFDRASEISDLPPRALKSAKSANEAFNSVKACGQNDGNENSDGENVDFGDDCDEESEIGNNDYSPTDIAENAAILRGINTITAEKVRAASCKTLENDAKNGQNAAKTAEKYTKTDVKTDVSEAKKALVTEKLLKAIALSKASGVDKEVAKANLAQIKETLMKLLEREKSRSDNNETAK